MTAMEKDVFEEETEENGSGDGEIEQTEKPWDAKLIRVDQKVYSIRQIMDMIDDGSLDLNPDFQRLQVWEPKQKSRLIESVFLRIPIPTFYFSSDMENNMQVVDGVQRLSSIHEFYKDRHKLGSLEYLLDLRGKCYSGLKDKMWGRRFDGTQLQINVIDPQTPLEVKFGIFKRINTGGTPLNAQEIRHCLSSQRSRKFLADLASMDEFDKATKGVMKNHKRMADRELALRFCALKLWREGKEKTRYEECHGEMDKFLDAVNELLGTEKSIGNDGLDRLKDSFLNAMNNAFAVFGDVAFRKNKDTALNKALFDSLSVGISKYDKNAVESHADEIKEAVYKLIAEDSEFIDAISQSTNSVKKVKCRFERVETLLERIIR